ncbi:hypothetical protein ACEZCY_05050 [Streptacidiphilus sp. N1-12]|uniref:Uncharacterized protein n=2 Tax=Streptacidiphilus alkalitolerans TaxID=3342712 RepID=A0ABV6V4K2_9ACTN
MKLRTLVLATATALAATALALPVAPVALADSSAPATSPVSVARVKTVQGTVLSVTAVGATSVTATYTLRGTTESVTVPLTEQSPGAWLSGVLQLPYGYGAYVEHVTALDGDVPLDTPTRLYPFRELPVFQDVASTSSASSPLTYGHETVTVTGRLTTYDPASGYSDAPFVTSVLFSTPQNPTTTADQDGRFSITAPIPLAVSPKTYTLFAGAPEADPSAVQVYTQREDTRIVMDPGPASVVAGRPAIVTGTLQYLDATDPAGPTWKPVPGAPMRTSSSNSPNPSTVTSATGAFGFTWPAINSLWWIETGSTLDPYLRSSDIPFTFASIIQQVSAGLSQVSIDAHGTLHFTATEGSTDGIPTSGHLYLESSADGTSRWGRVKELPQSGSQTLALAGANPHAWYRLHYVPDTAAYLAATSRPVHVDRDRTRITGGKPNHTTVTRNVVVAFTGHVQYQTAAGSWLPARNTHVLLEFRPYQGRTWSVKKTATTSSTGAFTLTAKDTAAGTWQVVWDTPSSGFLDSTGPATYVHIR